MMVRGDDTPVPAVPDAGFAVLLEGDIGLGTVFLPGRASAEGFCCDVSVVPAVPLEGFATAAPGVANVGGLFLLYRVLEEACCADAAGVPAVPDFAVAGAEIGLLPGRETIGWLCSAR